MPRFRSAVVLYLCLSPLAGWAAAQQAPEMNKKDAVATGNPSSATVIPNLTIEIEKREKISGIPPGTPVIVPTLPLDDGALLVRYIELPTGPPDLSHPPRPDAMNPVLVHVKSAQETNRFDDSYPGLSDVISEGRIAASKNQVVLLVRAITKDEKLNAPDTPPHQFLVFYHLNGSLKKIAAVNLGPTVYAMGVFASGEILIANSTSSGGDSMRMHLSIYDDEGEFEKELFQNNPEITFKNRDMSSHAGEISSIFPYGDNLLTVYRSDKGLRLEELNPSGLLREWNLTLPQATVAFQLIPSDGPYWLVSYMATGQTTASSHRVEGIFEFDKATSEVVGNLTSTSSGILTGAVYQHDGEIVGLLTAPQDYSLQIAEARIGGK